MRKIFEVGKDLQINQLTEYEIIDDSSIESENNGGKSNKEYHLKECELDNRVNTEEVTVQQLETLVIQPVPIMSETDRICSKLYNCTECEAEFKHGLYQ